jgi:hypothetical protein
MDSLLVMKLASMLSVAMKKAWEPAVMRNVLDTLRV